MGGYAKRYNNSENLLCVSVFNECKYIEKERKAG